MDALLDIIDRNNACHLLVIPHHPANLVQFGVVLPIVKWREPFNVSEVLCGFTTSGKLELDSSLRNREYNTDLPNITTWIVFSGYY